MVWKPRFHCWQIAENLEIYSTLLDAPGISLSLILKKNSEAKEKKNGSFSESELQKLRRMYTQGDDAYESVRNLVKTSNLPMSERKQFYIQNFALKITLATR